MEPRTPEKMRYDNLDGLRAYSAIGIILMHVLANGGYELDGFLFSKLIPSFTDLVFLFMVISGFSMSCGYYEKIINGQISLDKFYIKRFKKVWPFFAVLCVLDFAFSPSLDAFYELLADMTLCFGLIPNANIGVIGVGWFLGLVFVFYFTFPFFCFLLSDKKRAWFSLGVAAVLSFLCTEHFDAERTSMAYSALFFLTGGMIYLYREPLRRFSDRFGWLVLLGLAGVLVVYYQVSATSVVMALAAGLILIYAIRSPRGKRTLLHNPMVKKLGDISMEVYLCHMMVYRVIEKLGGHHLVSSDGLSYLIASIGTIVGTILFCTIAKYLMSRLRFLDKG